MENKMKRTTQRTLALLALLSAGAIAQVHAATPAESCNRACLESFVDRYGDHVSDYVKMKREMAKPREEIFQ